MDLLFTPAKLGTCELKNRIVRSATNEHLSDEKGQVTPLWADTLIELAKNEVGLVITGHFCVDKMQRADAGQPVLDETTDESLLRRACDGVHRYGAQPQRHQGCRERERRAAEAPRGFHSGRARPSG